MSAGLAASQPDPQTPLYARVSRRIRGMVFDWIVTVVVFFGAVALAIAVSSDNFSRILAAIVLIALLLYEPVLVAATGGTLGHYFANLRVVDDGHGGNVSFGKACARFAIKSFLGLYSFIAILATRRNQALHDLLTRSTVQIRDRSRASYGHYIEERTEVDVAGLPSAARRIAVILGYLILASVVYVLAFVGVVTAGIVSERCIVLGSCLPGENLLNVGLIVAWIAVAAACIGFGWRGRLIGARVTHLANADG